MKRQDFFTKTPSNNGSKMELIDPATNKLSGESLTVLGFDSDVFNQALNEKRRDNVRVLTLPKEEQEEQTEIAERKLIASLVTGWTFEEAFTEEGLLELIIESPSVKNQIDKFASNRANFINPR